MAEPPLASLYLRLESPGLELTAHVSRGILNMKRLGFLPGWPMLPHLRSQGLESVFKNQFINQLAREQPSGHSNHSIPELARA